MKTLTLLIACVALTGCATIKSELSKLPPASAASANFELSGKFTSTTVTAKNYVNDGKTIKADALTFDHSDPWVTKLHWEGTQVSLQINQ